MKKTHLVQRLCMPLPHDHPLTEVGNPFAFGGGFKNGGLSQEAMELLSPIFSFDYMGAAEFEFGAVPKALAQIVGGKQDFVKLEVPVPWTSVEVSRWEEEFYQEKPETGSVTLYVYCHKDHAEGVKELILKAAKDERSLQLMEQMNLAKSLLRPKGERHEKVIGWLELDNGFLIFRTKEAFDKTVKLFEG